MTFLKQLATWTAVVLTAAMIFGFLLLVTPQYRKLSEHERRLEALREDRSRTHARLQELRVSQQRFQTDAEYVRRVAHERGMVGPGETQFRFLELESMSRSHGL